MVAFLVSEVAFFCTLIVVYLAFLGANQSGPTPAVLSLPLVIGTTVCLLSSSVTICLAERSLRSGARSAFIRWWSATISLGIAFLAGTAYEWNTLIIQHGLTISRNLFGTTYYTLVGFHAFHVTVGVIVMLILLGLTLSYRCGGPETGWCRAGVLVLALCRRRLGGGFHGGVSGRKVRRADCQVALRRE